MGKANSLSTARMRMYMVDDLSDAEIAAATGWEIEDVQKLRAEVIAEEEVRLVGRRSEEVFVEYAMKMTGIVKELDVAINELKQGDQGDRQGAAIMSGIRAKAAMHDRVIKLGQQMGFVKKEPEKKVVVLASLTDRELAQHLQLMMRRLDAVMDRGGESVIDIDPDRVQPVLSMHRASREKAEDEMPELRVPRAQASQAEEPQRRGPVRRKASGLPRGPASE